MKKKIILLFIILLGLFTITGCSSTKKETSKSKKKSSTVDETLVTVNGMDLHINQEKEFKGIHYTIAEELKEASYDQYVQYNYYQESGPNLLFFRIFYYEGKNHNDIRNDLAIDSSLIEENGKTDHIEYTYIDTKRNDGTIHFYIIDKDNTSYAINFISQYDIKDFEKKVLNSIQF